MDEVTGNLKPTSGLPKNLGKKLFGFAMAVIFPLFMFYIFGYSIKTTPEYTCALQVATQSRAVLNVTGYPAEGGFLAWTQFFESGQNTRNGAFSTRISGPQGSGRLEVSFYRTPVGDALGIWFIADGEERTVYDGVYPCEE